MTVERKHPLAKCEECPLYEGTAFVPSVIPKTTDVAVIGEAPGFQEGIRGVPFIGPSGRLLRRVLQHHDISEEHLLLTNVCLCRPPDNATPSKDAVAACRSRLLEELRAAHPRVVVAAGGTAAQAVLGVQRGITSLRVGPPKVSNLIPGAQIIPTWHPAYCLRTADAFPDLVGDIGKIKYNAQQWEPPTWAAYEEPEDVVAVLVQLAAYLEQTSTGPKRVVVDVEWGFDKDTDYEHANFYDLLCVGLAYAKGKAVVLGETALQSEKVQVALKAFLSQVEVEIVGHNVKADLEALVKICGPLQAKFDTMLAHYAIDERGGRHGLKYLGVELLGTPDWDSEIARYLVKGKNFANIPRPILYKYNAYDVSVTWDLMELFEPLLDGPVEVWPYEGRSVHTLRDVHDHMLRAANQLMFLELNGIAVDKNYSDVLHTSYLVKLAVIEARIQEIVGHEINPRSPKQVKEYLTDHHLPIMSTNEDTLKALQKKVSSDSEEGQFISELLLHRRTAKLYGTYVKGIRKRMYRGRIYTTYMLHGTTSGRLASRNPNLQNVVRDKEIRKQFAVSKPENVFLQCDYKQAEGRIIAWLARDEYLREKFANPDVDLFNEISDDLYGPGNWTKEERVRTKAFFYGIGYGREPYSIALEYNMSPRDAQKRYDAFMQLIPATAAWQRDIRKRVHAGEDLITPFGRRRRFALITDENKKDIDNEALSYVPQSTASDVCLSALIRLRPVLRGIGFIRLTIHDALVVETHEDRAEEVAGIVKQVMEEEGRKLTDYVPFPVDTSFGKSWGDL